MISTTATPTSSPRGSGAMTPPDKPSCITGQITHNGQTYTFSIKTRVSSQDGHAWEAVAAKVAEYFQANLPANATIKKSKILLSGKQLTQLPPDVLLKADVRIVKAKVTYTGADANEQKKKIDLAETTESVAFEKLHTMTQTSLKEDVIVTITDDTVEKPINNGSQTKNERKAKFNNLLNKAVGTKKSQPKKETQPFLINTISLNGTTIPVVTVDTAGNCLPEALAHLLLPKM